MVDQLSNRHLFAAILVVGLAGCGAPPEESEVPEEMPPPTEAPPIQAEVNQDHYLCYREAAVSDVTYPVVYLKDQFWSRPVEVPLSPHLERRRFCNPVRKEREGDDPKGIKHPDDHLLAVRATYPTVDRPGHARVRNQFYPDGQDLVVDPTGFLMLPSQKLAPRQHGQAGFVDHFQCYEATSATSGADIQVNLDDQLEGEYKDVAIGDVKLLCNPTDKRREIGGEPHPGVRHENDHLVCYEVSLPRDVTYTYTHQLVGGGFQPQETFAADVAEWLCLPSDKTRGDGWWS